MFFLFLLVDFSFGQYIYSGGTISAPTTWNGYDFYYIDGNILITTGGSLTIAPNTGSSNPVYVVFRGGYGISIEGSGSLSVSGTSSRNIFLTADRNDNQVYGETGETWLNLSFNGSTGNSVIDYAVIEHGTGDGFGVGGGIDIYGSNVTVRNTTIHSCDVSGDGGGLYVEPVSSGVILQNLSVYDNTATGSGGGLLVNGNVIIEGSQIYSNSANLGDGLYLNTTCTISNSIIHDNSGEGVYVNGSGAKLSNCLIYGNSTGVYFLLAGNLVNCDVVNNTLGLISYSYFAPKIVNSILWGNTTEYTITSGASLAFANCGIKGGLIVGLGLIDGGGNKTLSTSNVADTGPNFVNELSNFHINSWITPLVDGGIASYSGITAPGTDIEGKSRISTLDIGAYEFFYYIWTGVVSTSWSASGNWVGSPASIPEPVSENKVVIPNGCSYYPTTSGLTLSNRSKLIIESQASLNVTGTTAVGSGCTFLLKSDINGSANFIPNIVSGLFTVEMFLAGDGDPDFKWHYVTTPVNSYSKNALTTDISNPYNLLNYYEPIVTTDKNTGWQWHDGHNSTIGFSTLFSNRGYNVYVANDQTAVFTGLITSGSDVVYSSTMLTCGPTDPDQNGWNLIANQFTSVVDAETFVFGADLVGPGLDKVVYFTKNNGYTTYNTYTHVGTGATRYIPALQGFFVHAKTGRYRSLTIPASGRVNSISPLYKGKGTQDLVDFPYLKINISDGAAYTDEAIIYFFNDATTSFDGDYDAYKMLSENPARAQIYTISSGLKLAVNGLPKPEIITEVPLKVWAGETKNYTINVLDLQNLDNLKVTLINGVNRIDLKANPNYIFSATASTLINMAIEFDIITDVNVPEKDLTTLWYSSGLISIKTGESGFEDNSTVVIYDINGREVFSKSGFNIGKGEIIEIPVHLQNGLYITTVLNNYRKLVKKIAVVE